MMGKCSKASNQTSKAACKYGSQCYRKDMWMSFIKNIWNLNNSKVDFNTSWTRSTGTQMKQRKFRRTKRNLPSQIGTLHQMIFNMSHQMLRAKEENTIKATTGRFRKIAYQIRHSCFWVFLEEPKVFNKPANTSTLHSIIADSLFVETNRILEALHKISPKEKLVGLSKITNSNSHFWYTILPESLVEFKRKLRQ